MQFVEPGVGHHERGKEEADDKKHSDKTSRKSGFGGVGWELRGPEPTSERFR